jgi:parallel beta-helix repeat protein
VNKKLLSSTLLIILVAGFTLAGTARFTALAATNIAGIIDSNTTWTKANSPYTLTNTVSVNNGAVLTIEAGSTVNLNGYNLNVEGTLFAKGTNNEKITFNGGSQSTGLTIKGSSIISDSIFNGKITVGGVSKISNCNINGRIEVVDGSPIISDNTIHAIPPEGANYLIGNITQGYIAPSNVATNENNIAIFLKGTVVDVLISNNTISGGAAGIKIYSDGNVTIQGNIINDNIVNGIEIDASIYLRIEGNLFSHNIGNAIIDQGDKASLIIHGNTFAYELADLRNSNYNSIHGIELRGNKNTPHISDNVISGCVMGIDNGAGLIERNFFTNNNDAINLQYEVPCTVQNNTIIHNSRGIATPSSTSTIIYNNIVNSSETGSLWMTNPADVNATYNYWGSTEAQTIEEGIYTNNFGTVTFAPFLTEANQQAMPDLDTPAPTLTSIATSSPTPTSTTSPSQNPTATSSPTTTPTPTPSQEPQQILQFEAIAGVTIAVAVIGAGLGLLIYLMKRK